MPRANEFLIEYVTIGNSMKITAFDEETLQEASIIVPADTSREQMAQLAIRKLRHILANKE